MSRSVLAGLLAIVALLSAAAAVAAGPSEPSAALASESPPALATGVLSPRRVPGVVAEMVGRVRLQDGLVAVLNDDRFASAEDESCLIVEHGGERVFAHQPDRSVIPASTLKLVTGWAALRRLGPAQRFVTEVRASSRPEAGAVDRLWVVGGGDPLLATSDYVAHFGNQPQTHTSLEALADAVRASGVTQVRDRVHADDTRYDGERYLPSWKEGYLLDNEVGPISALVVNDNFTAWEPEDVAAPDPATHGAVVLGELLTQRGVQIAGPPAGGRAPTRGTVVVARVESPPLTAVVGQMLAESDNLTAEMLVKEMGHRFGGRGSWAAGLQVIRDTVAEAGHPLDQLTQLDGSGLERDNRVTCALLLDVLDDDEHEAALAAGLAVAGETGTLRVRLGDAPVRGRVKAKTGSIDNVAGLVGYAESGAGTLEFALVGNGLPRSARSGREFADAIARVLVRYPDVPPAASLEPLPPVPSPGATARRSAP